MTPAFLHKKPIKDCVVKGILNVLLSNETMFEEGNEFVCEAHCGFAEFYHHSLPPRGNRLLNKKEERHYQSQ